MRHAVIGPRRHCPAGWSPAAAFALAALVAAGCGGNKPGPASGEVDLRQAVLGKWAAAGEQPAGKGQTHEVTPDKWVVNTQVGVGTVTYTYTLDGDQLVQRVGSSPPMKSRVRVEGDTMTLTLRKEEHKDLYGQQTGEVVTRLQRVK